MAWYKSAGWKFWVALAIELLLDFSWDDVA